MISARALCLSTVLLAGCGGGLFGAHGTDRFTDKEYSVYGGVKYSKAGERSRWQLVSPPAVVEHYPVAAWKDHETAAKEAIAALSTQGPPEAVKTEEDAENGYTVTAAVWPGADIKRRTVMVLAEKSASGGGFVILCDGEANTQFPNVFGAYCRDLLRPVLRIARGK
jgi:hypothetical protein